MHTAPCQQLPAGQESVDLPPQYVTLTGSVSAMICCVLWLSSGCDRGLRRSNALAGLVGFECRGLADRICTSYKNPRSSQTTDRRAGARTDLVMVLFLCIVMVVQEAAKHHCLVSEDQLSRILCGIGKAVSMEKSSGITQSKTVVLTCCALGDETSSCDALQLLSVTFSSHAR